MKRINFLISIILVLMLGNILYSQSSSGLKMFQQDITSLQILKTKYKENHVDVLAKKLKINADSLLKIGPFSVTEKEIVPPSGNKKDYMSVGPYWWPDTSKLDRLPYIRNDGVTNPEVIKYDNIPNKKMKDAATQLSLAYFFTEDEKYAERAALLIRTWFLDEKYGMNPNLQFGQAIPGRVDGRGIGIIETRRWGIVTDAVALLQHSAHWKTEDTKQLKEWFNSYLDWLITSQYGKDERGHYNNHGTWFDVQAAHFALFTGRTDIAEEILSNVAAERIDTQIEPDGSQPHELKRTRSFAYSKMNLEGMFRLALLGENIGIDLWNYTARDGRSIRKALDYLVPYVLLEKEWEYEMIRGWEGSQVGLYWLLRIAADKYSEPKYDEYAERLSKIYPDVHNYFDLYILLN